MTASNIAYFLKNAAELAKKEEGGEILHYLISMAIQEVLALEPGIDARQRKDLMRHCR